MVLLQAQGRELETLRSELREQKELTAELSAKLNATSAKSSVGESRTEQVAADQTNSSSSAAPVDLAQKVTRLETDLGNSRKDIEERLKTLGPFAFSGDLRLRAEPTFGGPSDRSQDRFRERIRLRVNAEARLNDQLPFVIWSSTYSASSFTSVCRRKANSPPPRVRSKGSRSLHGEARATLLTKQGFPFASTCAGRNPLSTIPRLSFSFRKVCS